MEKNKGYRKMDILTGSLTGKMSEKDNGSFHGSDKYIVWNFAKLQFFLTPREEK